MIIKKKVASILKKSKTMLLATAEDGTQWAGQGAAYYSLAGLPQMNVAEVMNALDYTEEEKAKFTTQTTAQLGEIIEDNYPAEIPVDSMKPVYYAEVKYIMFSAGGRVLLINSELLQPVKHQMETAFFMRIKEDGHVVLCVKVGIFAEAVICDVEFKRKGIDDLLAGMEKIKQEIANGYKPLDEENEYEQETID
ncbi:MAG: hypothetical protein NC203_00475 [Firmicutes bacterium]|nr:hypothetical protein [[Eubacterium] siraeum]MCM1486814.1 hypothetical protein [Bacillota bacterium]